MLSLDSLSLKSVELFFVSFRVIFRVILTRSSYFSCHFDKFFESVLSTVVAHQYLYQRHCM